MYKVRVVCPARVAPGFALAGFDADAYESTSDAQGHIMRALGAPECGILVMDEALMSALDARTVRRVEESDLPLVIAIPMGVTAGAEREYLERVIRRVIGYQVRLK